jgi:uncharacterized protein YajQ (UPF0234 family)
LKVFVLSTALFFVNPLLAQSLEPGLWKSQTKLELNNLPLPESKDEKCVTASQAKDVRTTIEKELKKKDCLITKWVIKNQKLDAALECKSDDISATGKLAGDVTRKSYNLKAEATGVYKHIPAVAIIGLTGQWVKKCSKK